MAYRLQTEPPYGESTSVAAAVDHPRTAVTLRPRLDSIDFLRGLVMAIMVLDHARDFFAAGEMNPRDVTEAGLFMTRWITHFCAPVFIFLAGIAAFMYGMRGRPVGEVARFLLTRGLWMMLIEVTLVRFAWTFNVDYDFLFFQVIWVIGCSMVALAGLVLLPRWAIAAFSIVLIVGHNLLDPLAAENFASLSWLWMFIHAPGTIQATPAMQIMAIYPLVPWIAVMAAGYALGPLFQREESQRRRVLLALGLSVAIGFIVLRATNLYGDPAPWSVQENTLATVLSFLNCEKYPPSLLYLAMTLGPGLLVLAWFRSAQGPLTKAIVTIGRVPFLFYVAHIFLLHAMAVMWSWITTGEIAWLLRSMPVLSKPEAFGLPLPQVYLVWLIALALLYPLCRGFAAIKQRRSDLWLSYL